MLTGTKTEREAMLSAFLTLNFVIRFYAMAAIHGVMWIVGLFCLSWYDKGGLRALIGFIAGMGVIATPVWSYVLVRRYFERMVNTRLYWMIEQETQAVKTCLDLLQGAAYFNAAGGASGGAIAVDPTNGQIAVVTGRIQWKTEVNTKSALFSVKELRRVNAIQAGVVQERVTGLNQSSVEMAGMHQRNMSALGTQAANTGLMLRTENLNTPEVFINLTFEDAKAWVTLLDKLSRGNLEVPAASTVYPFPTSA